MARLQTDPLPENLTDLHAAANYLKLLDAQTKLKSEIKAAEAALDQMAHDKYVDLSVEEIKTLVVDDKWLAALRGDVNGELERVSQALSRRIIELAKRYEIPLPKLVKDLSALSARVDAHLKRMRATWA
jgi:type I restriction enzyme M protein